MLCIYIYVYNGFYVGFHRFDIGFLERYFRERFFLPSPAAIGQVPQKGNQHMKTTEKTVLKKHIKHVFKNNNIYIYIYNLFKQRKQNTQIQIKRIQKYLNQPKENL